MKRTATILALALTLGLVSAQVTLSRPAVTPTRKQVMDSISAKSMEGHLSFLASDLLEGRGTPSRGLDLASEYIAAQFRRAGLVPGVNGSYFQETIIKLRRDSDETGKVRNVIGVLPGSDPALKDTYVLVTAHYDHLGMRDSGEGDRIYNGANDDGSGTVSVLELAAAMSKYKPKRRVVFMTFYGEERGLVGSRYYAEHPVFPLAKTIAMINLEHMGRTDDSEGARVGAVSMTGQDFSDVGAIFKTLGNEIGVGVEKHPRNSDAFFSRSDNQALADAGIPSHTICTTFIFPDYHGLGDHWDKVDYQNMAKVDRLAALGIMTIADSATEPRWNEANAKTAKYVKAWKALKGQ
ncbi:MAG: M28 family peptidase [Fimbriimonas sp.]